MPSADVNAIKQNEKNSLLDLRLTGISIELHTRPSPSNSRPSSRIEYPRRAMSVIPTLFFQDKDRKTVVPWKRPQSADTSSERATFAKKHSHIKGLGRGYRSSSCLVESSPASSPSPDPAKLEPGLISKPPIPPSLTKHKHKSLDDIINMKFQRWFPESVSEPSDQYINMTPCSEDNDEEGRGITLESAQSDYLDLDRCGSEGSSRGGLTSPDIAIDTEENRRPIKEVKRFPPQSGFLKSGEDGDLDCFPSNSADKFNHNGTSSGFSSDRSNVDNSPRRQSLEGFSKAEAARKSRTESQPQKENSEPYGHHSEQVLPEVNYTTRGDNRSCDSPLEVYLPEEKKKLPPEDVYLSSIVNNQAKSREPLCETPSDNFPPSDNDQAKKPKKVTISNEPHLPHKKTSEHSPSKRKYFGSSIKKINSVEDHNSQSLTLAKLTESVTPSSKTAEILSWMGSTENNHQMIPETVAVNSTYDDLLNMIKVIEQDEEVESIKLEALSTSRSTNNSACSNVAARDILTFLDEVDKNDVKKEVSEAFNVTSSKLKAPQPSESKGGRLAQLLSMDRPELAQRCMSLSIQLDETNSAIQKSKARLKELESKVEKQKTESDEIIQRHQKFIDQLIREKKVLGEQCAILVKDMQVKHNKSLKALEERQTLELKTLEQKLMAAEKARRDKWVDAKTKRIKELTVKGLEPELNRMAASHQEQVAELRRCHEKELAEMEANWRRRLTASREQALRDREVAVQQEREAARTKLEHEMSDMERSYQEQRRRLMTEVREEKERLERELDNQLREKNRQLEDKWNQAASKLDEKLADLKSLHQGELKTLRETLEGERESWLVHQTAALSSKEKAIREECKKERDRHIESVLRKLDADALEKEQMLQQKFQKLKDQYETEVKELEDSLSDIKRKLKDARAENQFLEESNSKLSSDLSIAQRECANAKEMIVSLKLSLEDEKKNTLLHSNLETARLKKELAEERATKEELLSSLQLDKDKQLQQVFLRVKEAVSKKDDQIKLLQKERDAALEQFNQLENLLEQQRQNVQIN